MLQGPVGDAEETREMLSGASRWNAMIMHYTSWREFHTPTRYRARRCRLPWVQDPDQWENDTRYLRYTTTDTETGEEEGIIKKDIKQAKDEWLHTAYQRLDQLLEAIDYGIYPFIASPDSLAEETRLWDPFTKDVEDARHIANQGRKVWRNLLTFGLSRRQARRETASRLDDICAQERDNYEKYCASRDDPRLHLPEGTRNTPFCVTMKLPQGVQEEAAATLAQAGYDRKGQPIFPELAGILGTAGVNAARDMAQQQIQDTMMRPHPDKDTKNDEYESSAQYRRIIGIHCQDDRHQLPQNSHLRNTP